MFGEIARDDGRAFALDGDRLAQEPNGIAWIAPLDPHASEITNMKTFCFRQLARPLEHKRQGVRGYQCLRMFGTFLVTDDPKLRGQRLCLNRLAPTFQHKS